MPRLGGFPQNDPFDLDALFEPAMSEAGSGIERMSMPPGPERDTLLTDLFEAFQTEAGDLPAMIEELRGLMAGRDLTQLIESVAVPAMAVAFNDGESLADGHITSTWPAKIEYLVGLALSMDPGGDADTPARVIRRISRLISDIFDADQIRIFTASLANADTTDGQRELLRQQLKLEDQADRMPGYAIHLEQVDAEVFGRQRNYYLTAFGFDPADVIRATRLHTRSLNAAFSSAQAAVAHALNSGAPDATVEELVRRAYDPIALWTPQDVAASTGIAVDEITAMLDFFSAEYGCQPEFRAPGDLNRARTHPCIKVDNETYLVPDPWALSAVLHHRLASEPKSSCFDPQKYHKHRQDACERLVSGALGQVFGAANVHSGQHYDLSAGVHGEVDTLVCADWPLVFEAKAIALTESGRKGAPDRVDKKIKEILGKPLDQTNRALTYILDEGGRSFASTQRGKLADVLPGEVSGGTAIIVTFERIDPFASGGLEVAGEVKRPTWVVSLTDLLMVADILTDPAAFHHYARTRADMYSAGASTFAEADALGAYLGNRLNVLRDGLAEQATRVFIGHSSDAFNDFYTRQQFGLETTKPTTGVPDPVTRALATAITQPGWVTCVDAVMAADRSVWTKWNRFRKKHRLGGTFTLSDRVELVALPTGDSSLQQVNGTCTLSIPTHS